MSSDAALAQVLGDLDRATAPIGADRRTDLIVAYEPAWAIGQGTSSAPADQVGIIHRGIRAWLEGHGYQPEQVRVIYGGSVDTPVAGGLLVQPGVDGLFVGRAALDPERFAAIARTPLSVRVAATA